MKTKKPFRPKIRRAGTGKDFGAVTKKQYEELTRIQHEAEEADFRETLRSHKSRRKSNAARRPGDA